jgi:hypothetical protein
MPTRNQIVLIGDGDNHDEAPASAALTPGHLLYTASTGKVAKHATAGGFSGKAFAKEDALRGRDIDTAYAADDIVSIHRAEPGDVIFAFIKAGQNIAIGDKLVSAGDGTLIKDTTVATGVTVKDVVGEAKEAINLTAGGAVATRIPVLIW